MKTNLTTKTCFSSYIQNLKIKHFVITLAILLLSVCSYAQPSGQKITVKGNNINLKEFFKQIEKQVPYTFVYRDIILDDKKDVTVNATNKALEEVLREVLQAKDLDFKISNNTIILVKKETAPVTASSARTKKVTGTINDKKGDPLIGVSVVVKGTTNGTITDFDGRYDIEAPVNSTLVYSYIGYQPQEIPVDNKSQLNVTLSEDATMLQDVVVVGYGTIKKRDHTGSLSSIDASKILQTNKSNLGAALQGQVAGVDIVKANNKPGAGFNIMVRGQNKIKAEPGGDSRTDMNDINKPLYVIDGMFVSSMNDIAPDDIERIDILKDASSTAIYGSRGASGVVIITTKKGSEGRSHVEYNGNISIGRAMNQPDFLNAEEYVQYRIARTKGNNWTNPDYKIDLKSILGTQQYDNYTAGRSINWPEEVLETSLSQSHSARVYGNAQDLVHTFGLSYTREDGILGRDAYDRYNVSTSIDKKLNKVFKTGINIYTAYEITNNSGTETFRTIYRLNPLTDKYNEDGSLRLFPDATIGNLANPFLEMENMITNRKQIHAFGNIYLEYKPKEWLKFTTTFTPDITYSRYGEYRGKDTKSSAGNQKATRAIYDTENLVKYTWDNILYGEQKFGKDHNFNFMLGSSWYRAMFESGHMRSDALSNDQYQWYNMGAGTMKEMSSKYTQEQLLSYLSRINYTYKDKYLATFTGRYDGSSRLAKGNQWSFFPSAALGWRISEEAFMTKATAISDLKLRVSYGVSGNNAVDIFGMETNPVIRFLSCLIMEGNRGVLRKK